MNDGYPVINMSFGSTTAVQLVSDAVAAAWQAGAVLVASAMNLGVSTPHYPAAYANVIAVANSTHTDARAGNSNWGSWVDIAAPGTGIYAARAGGDGNYGYMSGTSMAAPHVAGAAALLRARGLSNSAIVNALLGNTDPINWGSTPIAGGRLNAYRAILPSQGCIRDIPAGAWVRRASGHIYQVERDTLRWVPDMAVARSWVGTSEDRAFLCETRYLELTVGAPVGYRPASLIKDPATGAVYLITTDGTDRALPVKRHVGSVEVFGCFGWQWTDVREGVRASLDLHPTGPAITSCNATLRSFPNGALVRASSGHIYVVEVGTKRHMTGGAYASWFAAGEWTTATDAELALIPTGVKWGYRPGRQIQAQSSQAIHLVSDDGQMRAQGSRREFDTVTAWSERAFAAAPITTNVVDDDMAHHVPRSSQIRDADWMP